MAAGDQAPETTSAATNGTESTPSEVDPEVRDQLLGARRSIDNIDAALIHLLAERFKYTQQVGRLKAIKGLPASDPICERTQIARLRSLAEESHLDPAFAEKWLNFVVAEVIHHHEQFAADSEPEAAVAES
jgi:chorismate mutase